jgi:hypothetical protein
MAGYRDPIKGETLTGYLRDVLEGLVRRIHGEGVATSPDGTDVSISHEEGGGADAISSTTYFALITESKGMIVPNPSKGTTISHEYRFVYAFREVDLVMVCFDGSGNTVEPDECMPSNNRYPIYENPQKDNKDIRRGVLRWPHHDSLRYPWAINLSEVLHPREDEVADGDKLFVYGANVRANTYPPYFQPLGVGQGPGTPPHRRAYNQVVEMHETTDSNGRLVRWFDNPGIHHGSCNA